MRGMRVAERRQCATFDSPAAPLRPAGSDHLPVPHCNSLESRPKCLALLIQSSVIRIMDWIATSGLLAQANADMFRPALDRAWPLDDAPHFVELLRAIDQAERELRGERDPPTVH